MKDTLNESVAAASLASEGVKPLLVHEIASSGICLALGVKAGNWVFANGLIASDFLGGVDPTVLRAGNPLSRPPKNEREARFILDKLERILRAGGAELENVVRLDQYYRSWKNVDPYHTARTATFGASVPASTSILVEDLLLPDADMDVQALALVPASGEGINAIHPDDVYVPAQSGHTPIVRVGDYVFLAGQLARGTDGRVPDEAKVPSEHRWKGTQITLESEFLIRKKLLPALESAGCSPNDLLKVQVYLEDIRDLPAFLEVWYKHFSEQPPAITVVPTSVPGFNTVGTHVEINVIAAVTGNGIRKETVSAAASVPFDGPAAVRAGDMLFISGLLAADQDGLIEGGARDSARPYFGTPAKAQMRYIIDQAEKICAAAGTRLQNLVRIQQFHTDLHEFQPACEAWQEVLGDAPLPLSAIGVPGPLAVPGATILADLWVYAP